MAATYLMNTIFLTYLSLEPDKLIAHQEKWVGRRGRMDESRRKDESKEMQPAWAFGS